MATLTITPDNPGLNFPRSYVRGFVGSVGVVNMRIEGNFLNFGYLQPYFLSLRISDQFIAPTSNVYSLPFVFVAEDSFFTIFNVPSDGEIHIKFLAMPNEDAWRIQVLSSLAIDTDQIADLPPVPSYWNPFT